MPDSSVQLDGFHIVRGDRDQSITKKTRGGGYVHILTIAIVIQKIFMLLERNVKGTLRYLVFHLGHNIYPENLQKL